MQLWLLQQSWSIVQCTPVLIIDKTPKLALRQIFRRQAVKENLCRAAADNGLLFVEMFAMLGQDLNTAKDTLNKKLWQADMSPFGATAAEQELSVMALAAV